MIDRQHGMIFIECDACGEVFESETDDFGLAWNAAKTQGWRTKKIGQDWIHACPTCEVIE